MLPGWTRERLRRGRGACVDAVSGDRPIAPEDPLRALAPGRSPDAVKVVVIGQDPYPTAGHADGLAFSAGKGRPRSLARVFELLAETPGRASSRPRSGARRLGAPGRAAAQSGADGRGRRARGSHMRLWLAGAHSSRSSHTLVERERRRRSSCSGVPRRSAFWAGADAADRRAVLG